MSGGRENPDRPVFKDRLERRLLSDTSECPPSPEPIDDHVLDAFGLREKHFRSTPRGHFELQVRRETAMVMHEATESFPDGGYKRMPAYLANRSDPEAYNRVRARWIQQGIWNEQWGGPFGKSRTARDLWERTPQISTTAVWGHEKELDPDPRHRYLQELYDAGYRTCYERSGMWKGPRTPPRQTDTSCPPLWDARGPDDSDVGDGSQPRWTKSGWAQMPDSTVCEAAWLSSWLEEL